MTTIGIRELRQHASRYVALAKGGERVAVTDRGTLVAYLVPAGESGSVLDRLEAAGQFRSAGQSMADLGPPPPPPDGERSLGELLAEMRAEERG